MVQEVAAFVVGGLVLAWAFRSAAYAFSGDDESGLHELAAPPNEAVMPSEADLEKRRRRSMMFNQLVIGAASLGVLAALVAIFVGAAVA